LTLATIISSERQYLRIPCDPIASEAATMTAGEGDGARSIS
jgi:hypothetical protein